jgi:sucrose-phosphate synthase
VCGDSGNDEEMLRGEPKAVIVSNFSHELKALRGSRSVFLPRPALRRGHSGGDGKIPVYRTTPGRKCR